MRKLVLKMNFMNFLDTKGDFMTLEQLHKEMVEALKRGDTVVKLVLSDAIAAVKNAAIAKRCKDNITEHLVNEVLLKEKKTLQEMIDTCPKDRVEILNNYIEQFNIISAYAPNLIDDEELIKDMVYGICEAENIELLKSNKGAVMKAIMPQFKGKADMKVVNQVVEKILQ